VVTAFVAVGTAAILWSLLLLLLRLLPFCGHCFCCCWDCCNFMVTAFVVSAAFIVYVTTQVMKFGSCLLKFVTVHSGPCEEDGSSMWG
jgi:hypothetical protein